MITYETYINLKNKYDEDKVFEVTVWIKKEDIPILNAETNVIIPINALEQPENEGYTTKEEIVQNYIDSVFMPDLRNNYMDILGELSLPKAVPELRLPIDGE